jgi:hypothetical protein
MMDIDIFCARVGIEDVARFQTNCPGELCGKIRQQLLCFLLVLNFPVHIFTIDPDSKEEVVEELLQSHPIPKTRKLPK